MKATFNFNVQIDGSKSVVTMDGDGIKNLDVDTLVALGKMFQGVQTKVNQILEKLYADKTDSEKEEVAQPEIPEMPHSQSPQYDTSVIG